VQEDVGELLLGEGLPVEADVVGALDERVELAGLAVHGHTAVLDQLVGLAARRDARTGEPGVQAHRTH